MKRFAILAFCVLANVSFPALADDTPSAPQPTPTEGTPAPAPTPSEGGSEPDCN